MSHSQFHCIDLFILRHAWLNLWDKHMTTGRINQVSYKHCSDACCIFWTLGTASLLQQDTAHPRAAASPFSLAAEAQAVVSRACTTAAIGVCRCCGAPARAEPPDREHLNGGTP
jgi:hypothetical protein